jgi:pimeloyl-[acyl-carrier protein] methyl ester esterase
MRALLLPGLDGGGFKFAQLAAALAPTVVATPIAYAPTDARGYDELCASIALPDEPFIIVAESFSGPIAIKLAATCPENLRGMVLAATFAKCPSDLLALLAPVLHPRLFRGSPPSAIVRYALIGKGAPTEDVQELTALIARVNPVVVASRLRAVREVDVIQEFTSIRVPTCYIAAAHDNLIPARAGLLLRELKPTMRHIVLDAPHLVLQRTMEPAASVIRDFARACAV